MTHITNIYDKEGISVAKLNINDRLTFINGRVWKGSKDYYKGVGCPYFGHFLKPKSTVDYNVYNIVEQSTVFYMGPRVLKKQFINKTGIFMEQYQPQFEDYIGSCGVKELALLENCTEFEKTSVDLIKSVCYDQHNSQYYFVLNYRCGRVSFLEKGSNKKLYDLLAYMIDQNWNFIWDKNTITDISYNGLVTDVADIFRSSELKHKIGTIYSVLYSLANADKSRYHNFMKLAGCKHSHQMDFVLNAIKILKKFGCNVDNLVKQTETETYIHTVREYLIKGKNCGDCSFIGLGDQIRNTYHKTILNF